jgi:hypothetical protein
VCKTSLKRKAWALLDSASTKLVILIVYFENPGEVCKATLINRSSVFKSISIKSWAIRVQINIDKKARAYNILAYNILAKSPEKVLKTRLALKP